MADRNNGLETLTDALLQQGFFAADEFGVFVTYKRANDSLKLHIGPDGSFAAFDSNDEVVAEGKGAQDLYSILVVKTAVAGRRKNGPARRAVSSR